MEVTGNSLIFLGRRFVLMITAAVFLSACSLDVSISDISESLSPVVAIQDRREPDFINGEIVTTNSGVVVKGVFGEISQKAKLSNGVEVDGVFYE